MRTRSVSMVRSRLQNGNTSTELASYAGDAHNVKEKEHRFVRSISLLTILALLYCPLVCAVGQGYAMGPQLCDASDAAIPVCCCCSSKSSTPTPTDSDDSDTGPKDCQGICSGAVHERHDFSIDLPELAFLTFYPAFLHDDIEFSTTVRKHDSTLPHTHVLSGRQLRTRLLALTC